MTPQQQTAIRWAQQHGFQAMPTGTDAITITIPWVKNTDAGQTTGTQDFTCGTTWRAVSEVLGY